MLNLVSNLFILFYKKFDAFWCLFDLILTLKLRFSFLLKFGSKPRFSIKPISLIPQIKPFLYSGFNFLISFINFRSTCKIDITWFPFDDQRCEMKFGMYAESNIFLNQYWFSLFLSIIQQCYQTGSWTYDG